MKSLKKLTSLLLALVMVFAMSATAFAADSYSITINNSKKGHTYKAYQIFAGKVDDNLVLTDITWGTGVSEKGQKGLGEAEAVAAGLTNAANVDVLAAQLVDIEDYLGTVAGTATAPTDGKYEISKLASGYYLVVDNITDKTTANDVTSKYIVQVVGNAVVTPKTGAPTFEKKVQDINDSTETTLSGLQDSADYDIGDDVPFTLTATLPADDMDQGYQVFKEYYLAFHDDMSEGLTLNKESFKVYLNSVAEENLIDATKYSITCSETDIDDFTLVIEDLKTAVESAKGGDKIIVTYTAELNEDANIGKEGNPNTAHLEYSGNPNWTGEGKPEDTVETPKDTVIVFTYQLLIDKVKSSGDALIGAEFTLYKKDPTNAAAIKDGDMEGYVALTMTKVNDAEFSFKGLDDGDYAIVETKTPGGYNTIDPILFTVSAGHTALADQPALESFTAEVKDGVNVLHAQLNTGMVSKLNETEKEVTSGQIFTEIVNQEGATLPSTGGIGTTMFYVIGAILVVGAAVVMITRKRMSR